MGVSNLRYPLGTKMRTYLNITNHRVYQRAAQLLQHPVQSLSHVTGSCDLMCTQLTFDKPKRRLYHVENEPGVFTAMKFRILNGKSHKAMPSWEHVLISMRWDESEVAQIDRYFKYVFYTLLQKKCTLIYPSSPGDPGSLTLTWGHVDFVKWS